MVITKTDGSTLAEMQLMGSPTVNDMATMLANAMLSPFTEGAQRPSRLYGRGYTTWNEVYPHLREIGIKVPTHRELSRIYYAFHARLRQLRDLRSPGRVEPTAEQAKMAEMFPAISKFVQDCGFIEIGDLDRCGFIVTAEDYDGVRVFEDYNLSTLFETLAALEKELRMWFSEKEAKLTSVTKKVGKSSPQ